MSPLIFPSCRDCPSYLVSAETVRDLLLPADTTVHEKWLPAETVHVTLLPAETVHVTLLPAETLGRTLITWIVSTGSYLLSTKVSAGSKTLRTVSAETKYNGQSLQEAKKLADSFIPCFQLDQQTSY